MITGQAVRHDDGRIGTITERGDGDLVSVRWADGTVSDAWAWELMPRDAESGVTRCPCCGDDVMTSDLAIRVPCDDCEDAGCEATRDGTGDLGYWNCQVR